MKVKWGVLGAGGIARRRTIPEGLMPADNCELAAVMDIAPGLAKEIADEFSVPKFYIRAEDLINDPDVQAIYIATPVNMHRDQFEMAVAAGKHVLIEKPLAGSLTDAEAMVELAAESDSHCTEGYMMKFHPLHEHAREVVQGGRLGKPVMIRGQLSCWYPAIEGAWRQDPEIGGGGSFIDMGTHVADLMQYILASDIVEVSAFCDTLVQDYPVEDSATVICRFENGCHGIIDAFFNMRDEACLRRLEIYGSQGGILTDGTIGQGGGTMEENLLGGGAGYDAQQAREDEDDKYKPVEAGEFNMYRAEVEYLSRCIIDNADPEINTLDEGLHVLRVAEAVYESARKRKVIEV